MAGVHGATLAQHGNQSNLHAVLEAVTHLTCTCINMGGCTEEQEGSWLWDACDQLLDSWASLVVKDSAWYAFSLERSGESI